MQGLAQCVNKGMQRDYSMDKASQEFAYENRNIRITTNGDNSFLSVTNEKSTTECSLDKTIEGVILGSATIGDYLVLFVKNNTQDSIYKIKFNDSTGEVFTLYQSTEEINNLNFDINNPIECITSYEGDEVQKVYWVDGKNQPRYINVFPNESYPENTSFDFVPSIVEGVDVNIEKEYNGTGNFESGVIQYYITYYKKFGAETNAVYQSSLYYISPEDRGGAAGEVQTCSFKITITPKTDKFDYVKVYSLIRNSLNSVQVSVVNEASINKRDDGTFAPIQIIDTNTYNTPVAPTDIMFLGGNTIIADTIEQKDNTLFLGNINNSVPISEGIIQFKNLINSYRNKTIEGDDKSTEYKSEDKTYIDNFLGFKYKGINFFTEDKQYNYKQFYDCPLSWTRYFKLRELYRIGIQFQHNTGEWSSTVWLQDISNNELPPKISDDKVEESDDIKVLESVGNSSIILPYVVFNHSGDTELADCLENIKKEGFINYRLVMAQPSYQDRKILSQGYVTPTVFRLGQRINGSCHSQASWFARPMSTFTFKHLDNINYSITGVNGQSCSGFHSELEVPAVSQTGVPGEFKDNTLPETTFILREIRYKVWIQRTYHWMYTTAHKYSISVSFGISKMVNGVEGELKYTSYIELFRDNYVATIKNVYNQSLEQFLALKYNATVLTNIKEIDNTITFDMLNVKEGDSIFKGTAEYLYFDNSEYPEKSIKRMKTHPRQSGDNILWWNDGGFERTYHNSVQRFGSGYTLEEEAKDKYSENYFLDATTLGFYAPNLNSIKYNLDNARFRIVGKADITKNTSNYKIETEEGTDVKGNLTNRVANFNFNNSYDLSGNIRGLRAFPLLHADETDRMYTVNVWNRSGSMVGNSENIKSVLKRKTFGNLWICDTTSYVFEIQKDETTQIRDLIRWAHPYGISDIHYTNGKSLISFDDLEIYKKDVSDALFYSVNASYLDKVSAYIPKTNITEDKIYSETLENKNININYSSSDHVVFRLPDISGQMCPLPGYVNPNLERNQYFVAYADETFYPKHTYAPFKEIKLGTATLGNYGTIEYDSINNTYTINKRGATTQKTMSIEKGNTYTFYITYYYYDNNTSRSTNYHIFGTVEELSEAKNYAVIKANNNANYTFKQGNNNFYQYKASMYFPDAGYNSAAFVISKDILVQSPFSYLSGSDIDENIQDAGGNYLPLFKFGKSSKGWGSDTSKQWVDDISHLRTWLPNHPEGEHESDNEEGINSADTINNSLWVCEFFRTLDTFTPYGGTSENALELNTFIPISDTTPIGSIIDGLEGDTYFQRWDSVRTYPTSSSDEQSVVDVVSIMLETHENLDGRYDSTRGRDDITNMRPENTEYINDIYSQPNNYITSNILDTKFNDSTHSNMYVWSLPKTSLSEVDNWTAINLISSALLDGNKGRLSKIKRWNNQLLAFQEKGIAVINYNNQTVMNTQEGIPVEIANSGKVTGHYYIDSNQGCKNKWSIVDSPYGLYFIDSYNKSINVFNSEGIKSLSTLNLFDDWIRENEKGYIWNSNNIQGFKSFYDPIHKEVYFTNNEEALCYNELLTQFTSFYTYGNLNTMTTINGHTYGIKNNSIHKMFEGNSYCNLFGKQEDYSITYKVNKDPFIDKTWTNIEYRADIFNSGNINNNPVKTDKTFDKLEVWNEYQRGSTLLNNSKYPKALNKFRIWRVDIPRDSNDRRKIDRIRNPWIMLKLTKNTDTDKRMEFHDLIIKYLQ